MAELLNYITENMDGKELSMKTHPIFIGMINELIEDSEYKSELETE